MPRRSAFALNPEFDGKLILAGREKPVDIGDGLTFTVAGPMQPELEDAAEEARRVARRS